MNQESVIVSCQQCGTKNRIPRLRQKEPAHCGQCHGPLSSALDGRPVVLSDATFQNEILSFPGVVLVDCWAAWCGPCRTVGPIIDSIAAAYAGKAKIAKLNVDENPRIASQYGIQSIPTLLFFKKGTLVHQLVGALPQQQIEQQLRALL